ncbi:flagellar biosynthesis anti-sigma factor FlgM [Sphingobium phenoxybenzoativorans]|uniref:Negative regulator of flagellin synthesis n=1 Tax=Sphingobium phenoxybenzoativorans TaxID=1592790 RepID=A0A975K6R6_9SPHN|nr:flagellar biosynthesis anti-sigma factor FlgM [Sphingobium phenoxybenzoativorans]QUT05836.1 flagellar biosynthesis anti-sigma factor FlgM [Sphingobium phenoxybenzoativorans]
MINSVGQTISSALEASKLRESGKARPAATVSNATISETASASASPVARMAAEGAPVDMDRVAAIKAAIASGNYPVDAQRIAERMIALDLPSSN